MWLKLYIGTLYLDKAEVDFDGMDTAKEKQRHLERLAGELYEENKKEIIRSRQEPLFYIHEPSSINKRGFQDLTWREIIEQVGSEQARNNINELSHNLTYHSQKGVIEL